MGQVDPTDVIAAIALVVTIIVAVGAGVWSVSSVRATMTAAAAKITAEIAGLRCAFAEFKDESRAQRHDHEDRIRKLESEMQDCPALKAYVREKMT